MDRFDMFVAVPRPNSDRFFEKGEMQTTQPSSQMLADQVSTARDFVAKRGQGFSRDLSREELCDSSLIDEKASQLLKIAARKLKLSGRSIVGIMRLSRTIADLDTCDRVSSAHVSEALSYRKTWSNHD